MDFRFKDYLTSPFELWKIHSFMKKAPFYSKEKMDNITLVRLREICKYANAHVPYYKKLFKDINLNPDDISCYSDFEKIPVLDKNIVIENFDDLQSDEKNLGAVLCETSGSTGTPLHFYLDKKINMATFALFWRTWDIASKWHIGCRQAMISGYAEGKYQYKRKTRILALSSFYLSAENVKEFYDLLIKYRPKFLRGYPSAIYLFGKLLEEQKLKLKFTHIFTGAESLLPFQKTFIEDYFECKVIDHFTHWERTASICECNCGRLHAQNDYGYHEILDEIGKPIKDSSVGRLVCTGLFNHAMPLIRYDTRDLASWSKEKKCKCGSNFPIINKIEGRIEDVILTPEGRLVGRLDAAFKYNNNIKLSCIYQKDVENITVKIVPSDAYTKEEEKLLLTELRKRLGTQINIHIEYVTEEQIPRTPRGKVRFVISEVPREKKFGHY